ncbi:MAG: hypothetical protein IJZ55_13605 [Lachnospiraceae bacterium]|nr:hypothetical protein [Lachnospiraceae bacterium]
MMKKVKYFLLVVLCLCLMGCNNEFAKTEYNDSEKIAASGDRYAKEMSVFNHVNGEYSLTVSKFNGRQTLWTKSFKEEQEVSIDLSFVLSKGQAKVVHIDGDDTVTTVMECTPDTCTEETVTVSVTMKKGKNRIKIVGYDCEDLELKMLFGVED